MLLEFNFLFYNESYDRNEKYYNQSNVEINIILNEYYCSGCLKSLANFLKIKDIRKKSIINVICFDRKSNFLNKNVKYVLENEFELKNCKISFTDTVQIYNYKKEISGINSPYIVIVKNQSTRVFSYENLFNGVILDTKIKSQVLNFIL